MAAAYAALVSLTHIIEQILTHDPHQPLFLDGQKRQLETLQEKVSFLLDFLEVNSSKVYNNNNTAQEGLESRIAEAAYAAEDIIESHVVDTILSQTCKNEDIIESHLVDTILPQTPMKKSKNKKKEKKELTNHGKSSSNLFSRGLQKVIESIQEFTCHGKSSSNLFSHGLQKVIASIDSVKKEAMAVKEETRVEDQTASKLVHAVLSRPPTTGKDIKVEYYKEDLEQIMDKLTGQSSDLQIIPIVGMGGIGKTTLARHIFDNQLIVECFPFRAWVTVSQEYNLKEILLVLLHQIGSSTDKQERCEYQELGERLHKHLSGRKYLIIIDDMWSADVWEKLKLYLPNYNNGSRVIITTRLLHVVDGSDPSYLCKLNLLEENKSWSLLCAKVFGHDGNCPVELEDIGKDIAKNCKGLPLSIVVIGGLLAKSEMTQEYWWYVAEHITQIVNSEDDGRWLKILYLSYNQLPIHLKPCFLYMGSFKEDHNIRISELIKLWVAEGFLKPCKGKSLEEAARDYLKDLIDRNLVFVREWGSVGRMKTCGIHDLLRDLCLTEARKGKFFRVVKSPRQFVNNERRIFYEGIFDSETLMTTIDFALNGKSFVRSVSCAFLPLHLSLEMENDRSLIRVLARVSIYSPESNFQLVNLRYLEGRGYGFVAPYEIWEMPQLRHIIVTPMIEMALAADIKKEYVLKNLQTLKRAYNLKFTKEVVARIPNMKKLSVECDAFSIIPNYNSLHNLDRLHNLQSLTCDSVKHTEFTENLTLPQSLKKLTLIWSEFDWDIFSEKVGSLPNLEKLKLVCCSGGAEWETVEGKFLHLKFLQIDEWSLSPRNLVCWKAESSHFPLLQHLVLSGVKKLKEIPSAIGDTLQSIKLDVSCGSSVIASAKEIVVEQESIGNEDLRLTIMETCN